MSEDNKDYRIGDTVGDYNLVCCNGSMWMIQCRYCEFITVAGKYSDVLKVWTSMTGDKIPYHCTVKEKA
jgi:hypothetical protein